MVRTFKSVDLLYFVFFLQRVVSRTVKMAARVSGGTCACAHEDISVITVSLEW